MKNRLFFLMWSVVLSGGFAQPTLAELLPNAGPLGATVTVSGGEFGDFQSTQKNRVEFNGVSALIQQWESDFIMLKVPMKATSGPVTVMNGDQKFDVGEFSVRNVEITGVEPTEAEAGSRLVIHGKHFGNTAGSRDPNTMFGVNQVLVDGIRAEVQRWRSNKIEVLIPANARSGDVQVRLASSDPLPDGSCCEPVGYITSNTVSLSVVPPITFEPTSGPVGSKIVLSGQDFGPARPDDGAVLIAGQPAGIAQWSRRTVVAHVPMNAKSGPVVFQAHGTTRDVGVFTLEAGKVLSMHPKSGPIGTLIVIRGNNFGILSEGGSTAYAFDFETGANGVEVGGVPAVIHRWLDNQIDVWVPYSAKSGEVVIKRGATIPNDDGTCCAKQEVVRLVAGSFSIVEPKVSSYEPKAAGLDEVVTIKGSGFGDFLKIAEATNLKMHHLGHNWENYRLGTDVSRSEVILNGMAAQVVSWTDTEIQVRVPRRHVFGIANPEGMALDVLEGTLVVKRGSWDMLENGECCTPKKWQSALAGPFTILKRGLPDPDYYNLVNPTD